MRHTGEKCSGSERAHVASTCRVHPATAPKPGSRARIPPQNQIEMSFDMVCVCHDNLEYKRTQINHTLGSHTFSQMILHTLAASYASALPDARLAFIDSASRAPETRTSVGDAPLFGLRWPRAGLAPSTAAPFAGELRSAESIR